MGSVSTAERATCSEAVSVLACRSLVLFIREHNRSEVGQVEKEAVFPLNSFRTFCDCDADTARRELSRAIMNLLLRVVSGTCIAFSGAKQAACAKCLVTEHFHFWTS